MNKKPVCIKTGNLIGIKILVLFVALFINTLYSSLLAQEDANKVAWDLANRGRFQEAINFISRSIEENPSSSKYLNTRAYFYFMTNNYDLSLIDCKNYVSKFPGNTDIYMLMGDIYFAHKEYLEAIEAFTKATDFSESMVYKQYCLLKRSSAYNKIELYSKAMEDLQESKKIFSSDSLYLHNLAYAQFHLNQKEEAKLTLVKLSEKYPEYPETFALYADIYESDGKYADALSMLKIYIQRTKASENQYEKLYTLALQQKDTLTAIDALEAKILHYNGSFDEEVLLVKMYCATGNLTQAALSIERVSNKFPDNAMVYKIKGDIHLDIKNMDIACDCYFQAFKNGYLKQYNDSLLEKYIQSCE